MPAKKLSYNEAFQQLEQILQQIEGDKLDVDELSVKVKKASELIKVCKTKLYDTEKEVEEILKDFDTED